jgi:hypothetical protein
MHCANSRIRRRKLTSGMGQSRGSGAYSGALATGAQRFSQAAKKSTTYNVINKVLLRSNELAH